MFKIRNLLKKNGVLGINRRSADYIFRYNDRKLYDLIDNKLRTKELANSAGIQTPELYGTVGTHREVRDIHKILENYKDFVIKPARGSGGDGIVIISGRMKDDYRKMSGLPIGRTDLEHYVSNILGGMYSLGGHPDVAMIERRVEIDDTFARITYLGIPDIRVIVFMGTPVMAMARLPTRASDGKANLHRGALGAGIDLARGETFAAVWEEVEIDEHPDTGESLIGVRIPGWDHILGLSAKCYDVTGLGYLGADIVLDRELGPLLLELNVRPGLNIQIANRTGLAGRLEAVEKEAASLTDLETRLAFAKKNFANAN